MHLSNDEGDKSMAKKTLAAILILMAFVAVEEDNRTWHEKYGAKFIPTSEQTVTVRGVQETPLWEK